MVITVIVTVSSGNVEETHSTEITDVDIAGVAESDLPGEITRQIHEWIYKEASRSFLEVARTFYDSR